MMNMKEKMHNGELYFPNDEEIMKEQTLCLEKLYDFMQPVLWKEKSAPKC